MDSLPADILKRISEFVEPDWIDQKVLLWGDSKAGCREHLALEQTCTTVYDTSAPAAYKAKKLWGTVRQHVWRQTILDELRRECQLKGNSFLYRPVRH